MYKINEFDVLNIINNAVKFGTAALNGQKTAMTLQIAEDDIKSLRATMRNYFFI